MLPTDVCDWLTYVSREVRCMWPWQMARAGCRPHQRSTVFYHNMSTDKNKNESTWKTSAWRLSLRVPNLSFRMSTHSVFVKTALGTLLLCSLLASSAASSTLAPSLATRALFYLSCTPYSSAWLSPARYMHSVMNRRIIKRNQKDNFPLKRHDRTNNCGHLLPALFRTTQKGVESAAANWCWLLSLASL